MASITIRDLDEKLKHRLRVRAAQHARSMEDEARDILRRELASPGKTRGNLGDTIHRRFAAAGGIELPPVRREPMRDPPDLGG